MYAPNLTDGELAAVIRELATEVATQDNRGTSFPCFTVQEKEEIVGVDCDYNPNVDYRYLEEGDEVEPADEAESELWSEGEFGERDIEGLYVATRWQNVAFFLTQKGADEFIAQNHHNHGTLRVYVASGHRSVEWQLLSEFFTRFGTKGEVPA
jgi:hypothetical protein